LGWHGRGGDLVEGEDGVELASRGRPVKENFGPFRWKTPVEENRVELFGRIVDGEALGDETGEKGG